MLEYEMREIHESCFEFIKRCFLVFVENENHDFVTKICYPCLVTIAPIYHFIDFNLDEFRIFQIFLVNTMRRVNLGYNIVGQLKRVRVRVFAYRTNLRIPCEKRETYYHINHPT